MLSRKVQRQRGSLVIAMVAILLLAAMGALFLKGSLNTKESTLADSRQQELAIRAQATVRESKKQIGDFMRQSIQSYRLGYMACLAQGGNAAICGPVGLQAFTPAVLEPIAVELEGENIQVECKFQGPQKQPCNNSHLVSPKVLSYRLTKWSDDKKVAIDVTAEIQLAPAKLNDYAYLVMNETSNMVAFAGGRFGGKVSVIFNADPIPGNPSDDPLVDDPNDPNDAFKMIRLMNPADPAFGGPKELVFDELFSMNIPARQVQIGIPSPYSTNNPPDPYYQVAPADFKKGIWPEGQAPGDLVGDFTALRDDPQTIKYQGAAMPRNAVVELGSPSDPCAMRIRVEVPDTNCYLPYRTNDFDGPIEVEPDGVTNAWVGASRSPRGIDTLRTSGGGGNGPFPDLNPGPSANFNGCSASWQWVDVNIPGGNPEGKVFYVNALQNIKVTSYGDSDLDRTATVCNRFTVLFGKDAWIAKSIERRSALGGTNPSAQEANAALVNLGGSQFLNQYTIPASTYADNLGQLKANCTTAQCRSETSINLEISLASVHEGGNALRVANELIDAGNPGQLGILKTFGTFVTDQLANNRTYTVPSSGGSLLVSGFSDVQYNYNSGIQLATPPGFGATSASFDWEMSETSLSTTYTNADEALLWAAAP